MWIGIVLICVAALCPVVWSIRRTPALRSERDSSLALYRGQLSELARDRALGLIGVGEYDAARLEVQRRLLNADQADAPSPPAKPGRAFGVLVAIPVLAFALYLTNGHPSLPAQPLSARHSPEDDRTEALIAQLRDGLARLPTSDPRYVQGYLLLGQTELAREHYGAAAQAWHHALDLNFDPVLALQIAEAQTRAEGRVSSDSLALFKRGIVAIPQTAPERLSIEARIAQGEHDASAPR